MKNKVVILDNGHGQETPGKRSPDGEFREYKWCREFVQLLKHELEEWGYIAIDILPEPHDLGLSARATRVNKIVDKYGIENCIFISIHNNAAGDGSKWYNATGWEAFTSPGRTKSDRLANLLYEEINFVGIPIRTDISDGDYDKESNFTVLTKTKCPAVLTENMFMDSKKDIEFLNSEDGIKKLLKAHLTGIRRYFENPSNNRDEWIYKHPSWDKYWKYDDAKMHKCNLK